MQSSPVISVIIVVWNSKAYLSTCLNKLVQQTFQDFEVVLIDNGSNDDALEEVEGGYPSLSLKIERLDSNHGFAFANNIGAHLARGRWLALLNADAFPEPDWLEKLLHVANQRPRFSCFSSRQIQANSPGFLDGTGDSYHVSGMAWKRHLGYPIHQYGLDQQEVFSPCAAAALYLRTAYLQVSGFDEDFFSYYEDVDLGFRLRLYGYKCLYVPDAIVYHVGSTTFGMLSDFSFYHSHRNLVWTFFKNMPTSLFWRYLTTHIIANLTYVLYYTFRGRGKVLFKAKWDALRGLPEVLKKRKEVQENRKVPDADLLHVMEHGWLQPFLLGFRLRRVLAKLQKDK